MALVALLSESDEDRRELTLAIEELGHRVASTARLGDAVALLGHNEPQLFVVSCDAPSKAAESALGEVYRLRPLLPVIVALGRRDAARAVELMRAGAYEVVAPPWTRENLAACVSKALRFGGTAFEAVRPRDPARSPVGAFLAAALCLGVALDYIAFERRRRAQAPPPAAPRTVWELPYGHPSGLAFRSGEFWTCDWYAQSVYRHDGATLAVLRTVHLPKETPAALALTPEALWLASGPSQLARHMLDDRLGALQRVKDSAGPTVAMAYDGLYLWTVDGKARRLRKRLLDAELTVLASYEYPGADPAALAYDGKALWSVDAGNRLLLRHSPEAPNRIAFQTALPEYQSGDWRPRGLAWDGAAFWTVAESRLPSAATSRLFRHRAGTPP